MGELIKPIRDFLGRGMATPLLRRGPADFVTTAGVELVRSCIKQIIGTRRGELPWNPNFGTLADKLRHKPNNEALEDLIRADLEAAIRLFEPRVDQLSIIVTRSGERLSASITWAVINKNVPGNQVLLGPDTFEAKI